VDIADRLPPLVYQVLLRGPEPLTSLPVSTLLSLLAAWDSALAAQYRALLLSPVQDLGLELRGSVGLTQELTDANKEDLLRRACAAKLVGGRLAGWAALRKGFTAATAGGEQVLIAVTAAGAGLAVQAALLFSVVHGTSVRCAREERRVQDQASLAEVQRGSTRCPHCNIPVHRIDACFHMHCRCGGQFFDCCGKTYPDAAHPSNYRCPVTGKCLS
jgi:hypothetical protein